MNTKMIFLAALVSALVGCGPAPESEPEQTSMNDQSEEPSETTAEAAESEVDPLTGTSWWVEDIDGQGVIDRSRTTIEFYEPGRVAGNASCNRYTGGYERDGDTLSFKPFAGTMMACPDALMNQERRFHAAMGGVVEWKLDADTDLLHLLDAEGQTLIRASRLEEDADDA